MDPGMRNNSRSMNATSLFRQGECQIDRQPAGPQTTDTHVRLRSTVAQITCTSLASYV